MNLILELAIIIVAVFGVEYYKRVFTFFSVVIAFITSIMLKLSVMNSIGTGLKVGLIVAAILILMNTNLVNFKKIFEKINIFKKFLKK